MGSSVKCRCLNTRKIQKLGIKVALLALLAVFAGRTAVAQGNVPSYGSIMDALNNSTLNLGGFKQLAEATGLNVTLANTAFVGTGFIPTDAALVTFAGGAGISGGISGLARLDPGVLLRFLQFHVLTSAVPASAFPDFANLDTGGQQAVSATLLSAQYQVPSWNTRMSCAAVNASDPETAYVVFGADGTLAKVITTDITVNNGTSYVHIIDAAMGYWYKDLRTAAYAFNFDYFYEGLVQANKTKPSLMPNNETRMYFPPSNDVSVCAVRTSVRADS
ncbi:hypothetical protein PLESTB_000871900 [Pleodorina starrii]|uniref:FAS1 domain-containing protein n=1 Tax=Pleodorina starrii TaxID=330485 RepID=A0A9W6BMI7_9CHLO|nr:hypothetical protein PLESTB_000871900 [Pleodorina starrii]